MIRNLLSQAKAWRAAAGRYLRLLAIGGGHRPPRFAGPLVRILLADTAARIWWQAEGAWRVRLAPIADLLAGTRGRERGGHEFVGMRLPVPFGRTLRLRLTSWGLLHPLMSRELLLRPTHVFEPPTDLPHDFPPPPMKVVRGELRVPAVRTRLSLPVTEVRVGLGVGHSRVGVPAPRLVVPADWAHVYPGTLGTSR